MERKDQVKAFIDRFYKSGDTSTKDLMPTGLSPFEQALEARDIHQASLANELSNIMDIAPIEKGDSVSKAEQKLMDKLAKNYPDMKGVDLKIRKGLADAEGARGLYNPNEKLIELDRDWVKYDPAVTEGTFLHEGSHAYDDFKGYNPDKNIDKSLMQKSAKQFKDLDPTEAYELMNKKAGHHAYIPDFREGSVGLGGLKGLAKMGKRLAVSAPLLKGAAAGAGGLASLAAEASDAEDVGESTTQENAMLSERNQDIRDKKMLEAIPDVNKDEAQQELEDMRRGVRRSALTDLLKK